MRITWCSPHPLRRATGPIAHWLHAGHSSVVCNHPVVVTLLTGITEVYGNGHDAKSCTSSVTWNAKKPMVLWAWSNVMGALMTTQPNCRCFLHNVGLNSEPWTHRLIGNGLQMRAEPGVWICPQEMQNWKGGETMATDPNGISPQFVIIWRRGYSKYKKKVFQYTEFFLLAFCRVQSFPGMIRRKELYRN